MSPQLFGSSPDFVVSGPNVGSKSVLLPCLKLLLTPPRFTQPTLVPGSLVLELCKYRIYLINNGDRTEKLSDVVVLRARLQRKVFLPQHSREPLLPR